MSLFLVEFIHLYLIVIFKSKLNIIPEFWFFFLNFLITIWLQESINNNVRQSNIQLTCCSYRRNYVKSRLRCSLLNCNHTLQVLQQVATNDYKRNGRCITQIAKHERASVHIVKQQTATFQTYGPGSVHLYATHDILTCIVHTDVYNLDLRILNIYTCVGKLILHWHFTDILIYMIFSLSPIPLAL